MRVNESDDHDEPLTLIRYGLMGHVGWFAGNVHGEPTIGPERGQLVVIRTNRGEELGEVLIRLPSSSWERKPCRRSRGVSAADPSTFMADDWPNWPRLVRAASSADLENSRQAERLRGERFEFCRQILAEACWPLELLDVEPLLDLDTTVLHILGPWELDLALLCAHFRGRCDFHVVFEYSGSRTVSSFGEATEPCSVPVRGWCACCDGAEGFDPVGEDCASHICCDQAHTSCAGCEIKKWLAGTR